MFTWAQALNMHTWLLAFRSETKMIARRLKLNLYFISLYHKITDLPLVSISTLHTAANLISIIFKTTVNKH